MKLRFNAPIGVVTGLAQGATNVHLQVLALIAATIGLTAADMAWVPTLGLLMPLIVSALTMAGDAVSTKVLCIVVGAISATGAAALAGAGFAAANGHRTAAFWLVVVGSMAVPTTMRHGDLVVSHMTAHLKRHDQLRTGAVLRSFTVVGIYAPAFPAGVLADTYGWTWIFVAYAAMNAAGVLLLARRLAPGTRHDGHTLRDYVLELWRQFHDRRLAVAACASFLIRAAVLACTAGLPVALVHRGFSPAVVGFVIGGGMLAAPIVFLRSARRRASSAELGMMATATPLVLVLVLGICTSIPATSGGGIASWWWFVGLFLIVAGLTEAAKQVGQLMTTYQATVKAKKGTRFRRLGVVNLGGNLGTMFGAWLGLLTATLGERYWWGAVFGLALLYLVTQICWHWISGESRDHADAPVAADGRAGHAGSWAAAHRRPSRAAAWLAAHRRAGHAASWAAAHGPAGRAAPWTPHPQGAVARHHRSGLLRRR